MLIAILSLLVIVTVYFILKIKKENDKLKDENAMFYSKYEPIIDVYAEYTKVNKEIEQLKSDYQDKLKIYNELLNIIKLYSDNIEMYDIGLYEPKYNFDSSEKYKNELEKIREQQKQMIKNKDAVVCDIEWTVSGSKAEGKKMTDRQIKLTLKAFNGQCDTIIKNVSWNNILKMIERIHKTCEEINKLNEPNHIEIKKNYVKLKIKELNLVYEYEKKKQEEKEEQRKIKEQIREEEKLQKEIEKKQKELENQEKQQKELQEQLRIAFEQGQQEKAQELQAVIDNLTQTIEDGKRAVSQAQLTKVGHVYIISNIGSFGENIYKIGMTRRLEPQDRVDELGDASVPFKFDVHAMIKSDNAPELENKLHELFKNKSVNRINYRKEFFNVTLEEIEKAVKEYSNSEIEFTKIAEASEFRETQAIIKAESNIDEDKKDEFPINI